MKKDDSIVVISDGKEYKYSTYKNTSNVELSIVIPSYNEENRLGRTLEASLKVNKSIIINSTLIIINTK